MVLRWEWDGKVGTFTHQNEEGEEVVYTLYEGNACLIGLIEHEETWQMGFFFADAQHMKNCLGISKEYGDGNMFERTGMERNELMLYRNKMNRKNFSDVVKWFSLAFNNLVMVISNDV